MPKKLNIHYCVWAFPGNFDTKRRFSYKFYFVFLVGGGRRSVYFERLVRNLKGRGVDWAKLWISNITYDFFYHISIENSITYYINVFCIVLYLLINAIHFFSTEFCHICLHSRYLSNDKLVYSYKDPESIVPVFIHENVHFFVDRPIIDLRGTFPHYPRLGQGSGTGLDVSRKWISNRFR